MQFGKFYCDAFTSPKSRYLPKLLIALSTSFGIKYGMWARSRAEFRFATRNFKLFPQEIKDGLASGDSRYLRKYSS